MILRLGLNAAVHTLGGMVLGMLAVGTAVAACRSHRSERKRSDSGPYPPPPPAAPQPGSTEAPQQPA